MLERYPPLSLFRQPDTHRLIPAQFVDIPSGALRRLTDDDTKIGLLAGLRRWTDEVEWAERDWAPGISPAELVYGVPNHQIINNTFCNANPFGSRFSSSERGAWYAAFELETAQAEIIHHRNLQYAEVNRFEDTVRYCDFLADFSGSFHDLRTAPEFASSLDPDSYEQSQFLAFELLTAGSAGVVYPSVRRPGGTCIACFRPALVVHVRRGPLYEFTWAGSPEASISPVQAASAK